MENVEVKPEEQVEIAKKTKRKQILNDLFRVFIVIITAAAYALAVEWFLEPANLMAIGATGLGQILQRLFDMMGVHIPLGVFTLCINIP